MCAPEEVVNQNTIEHLTAVLDVVRAGIDNAIARCDWYSARCHAKRAAHIAGMLDVRMARQRALSKEPNSAERGLCDAYPTEV